MCLYIGFTKGNLPHMSYFKNRAGNSVSMQFHRLLTIAAMLLIFVSLNAYAVPKDRAIQPQHEDHVVLEPIIRSTGNALCESGVSGGYACNNIELMSRITLDDMGGGSGNDSWGWKDPQSGRYYALMGRSTGTSFIDVSDPAAPVLLGSLPTTLGDRPWRDIKVYADHAFIVADGITGHGMQVFDLTRLRGVTSEQVFTPDALYTGVGSAHNIAINEQSGFAYIVGSSDCNGGLHIVDISSPKTPVFAGCFADDGYTHDVQCVTYAGHDADHLGSEVCFASNIDSLTIIDVSKKNAPVLLGKVLYPDTAYAHQGWFDQENGIFFMGDETDELNFGNNTRTLMFDVRDLDEPVYADSHLHATSVIDHNMYVKNGYLFQANYKAGLRILKINGGQTPGLTEMAYFDTDPTGDSFSFAGAWNVYPFFDNDTLLVSDMSSGLFVLKATIPGNTADASPLNGSMSGAWVSEGLNDQGIMLYVEENASGPIVFYTWFVFLDGSPFWVTGAAPFEYGDDEVVIPSQRLSGLGFVTPDNSTAIRENIGNLTIHVHGCNELHVEYDFVSLGSQELDFTRLAGVQGRVCTE
ncbi:MAG: choice-of-anchor B domain-containing protein [Lysobacterales bacterium]|jgi:choice-of-anchor B domain-containing protein